MKTKLTFGLIGLLALAACDVSTGVRSPCFEGNGATVTRSLSFAAGHVAPVEGSAHTANGGSYDCDFQNL